MTTAAQPRIIRDKDFTKRLEIACENHSYAPSGHGRQTWVRQHMNERGHPWEVIEQALAHNDGSVRAIYNRAQYWDQRVSLIQVWADLIDTLKENPSS